MYEDSDEFIVDVEFDEDYEPTKKDIADYARIIGIEPEKEPELLWIAKEGFSSILPKEWRACFSKKRGEIFYVNLITGDRTQDDPCDKEYRNMVKQERLKIIRAKTIEKRRRNPPKLHFVEMHVQTAKKDDGSTVTTRTIQDGYLDGSTYYKPESELLHDSAQAIDNPTEVPSTPTSDHPVPQITVDEGTLTEGACSRSEEGEEELSATIEPADDETHVSILLRSLSSKCGERIIWKRGLLLGKGACSKVWKGLTSTGELVAVKQIELDIRSDDFHIQCRDIIKEVDILKTLRHKNVVRFIGASLEEESSHVCIFMEFAPGGSIQCLIQTFGPLDEPIIAKYTKQIVEGVRYIHSKGVVHRDIKGQNIVVTNDGIIKLVDFGCAKRHALTIAATGSVKPSAFKTVVGTPHWMAPEVVTESGHGKKSDIWSIGCTVYEMATGNPPWADMEPVAAIFAIGSGREIPELPGKMSKEARKFTKSCMTRDPSERPSAEELLELPFIHDIVEKRLLRNNTYTKSRESMA